MQSCTKYNDTYHGLAHQYSLKFFAINFPIKKLTNLASSAPACTVQVSVAQAFKLNTNLASIPSYEQYLGLLLLTGFSDQQQIFPMVKSSITNRVIQDVIKRLPSDVKRIL